MLPNYFFYDAQGNEVSSSDFRKKIETKKEIKCVEVFGDAGMVKDEDSEFCIRLPSTRKRKAGTTSK